MGTEAAAATPVDTGARTLIGLFVLGIASGLPNELTQGTLQAWLTQAGYEPKHIGLLQAAAIAYGLKFLWAPVVDRWSPPFLGRRRGWLALLLVGIALGASGMGLIDPQSSVMSVAIAAGILATIGATYDLVLNGYACDALTSANRATGAGLQVWGWRIGFLAAGAALWCAARAGWPTTFVLGGLICLACGAALFFMPEPANPGGPPATLGEAIVVPLRGLFVDLGFERLLLVLGFALLYRIADGMAGSQQVTFLISGAGFKAEHLGLLRTVLGLVGAGLGVLFATLTSRGLGEWASLGIWGALAALSNLVYPFFLVAVPVTPRDPTPALAVALLFDNICAGAVGATMVGYLLGICRSRCAATQYALLTAIMALGRFVLAPSGYLIEPLGWTGFWIASAAAGIPGLVIVYVLWRFPRPPAG